MKIVEAESDLLRAAGKSADLPPPERRRRRLSWPLTVAPGPALAVLTACAAAIALAAGLLAGLGGGTRTLRAQITNPAFAGRVQASLVLRGSRAELRVKGLPVPAANHVDECWVMRGGASPVAAGTFVLGSGSVQVAHPVHRGDTVLVTVERGRGSSAPTTKPFLMVRT
jgi:hypothetical protein